MSRDRYRSLGLSRRNRFFDQLEKTTGTTPAVLNTGPLNCARSRRV